MFGKCVITHKTKNMYRIRIKYLTHKIWCTKYTVMNSPDGPPLWCKLILFLSAVSRSTNPLTLSYGLSCIYIYTYRSGSCFTVLLSYTEWFAVWSYHGSSVYLHGYIVRCCGVYHSFMWSVLVFRLLHVCGLFECVRRAVYVETTAELDQIWTYLLANTIGTGNKTPDMQSMYVFLS